MSPHRLRLHFHRYEFKYRVSGETFKTILHALENRMERDEYSSPGGQYYVRSLYFDTSDFRYHQEKEAGLHSRYKFRIRSYSEGFSDPLFLELKGKQDNLVYKHRQPIPVANLEEAMSGGISTLCEAVMNSRGYNGVGSRFVSDCYRCRLSPSLVVDYRRSAFENSANPDFRATIDTGVMAWKARRDGSPSGGMVDISPDFGILEIKFRYHLPSWFHQLIQRCELNRVPFSKFHRAGERLWMLGSPSLLNRRVERGRSWPL
jgi:hypothetical protein